MITETINLSYTNVPTINVTIQNLICPEDSSGIITISMNGGTPPYQYNWNDGNTTQNRNNISGGIYIVSITDFNSCIIEDTILVYEPTGIYANSTNDVDSCDFGNGEINIGVSGGTGHHSFLWNNGATTSSLSNIQGGNYTLTVTDANGC